MCGSPSCPGNHDCDHSANSDLRQIAIDGVASKVDTLSLDGAAVRELLSVHGNFFQFQSDFAGDGRSPKPQLAEWQTFSRHGRPCLDVLHINTALMSMKSEVQGKLFFPVHAIPMRGAGTVDLIVTLMHHPYTWLESDNGLKVRKHIEGITDIVMTGHVHVESAYTKTNLNGENSQYISGGVLQDPRSSNASAFNIVVCDTERKSQEVFQFSWSGGIYRPQNEPRWTPFIRNNTARSGFENNAEYAAYLRDVGLGLKQPGKGPEKRLEIDDLFVYPQIGRASIAKPNIAEEIKSDDLVGYFAKAERVLVMAPSQAGKTTLARKLYRDLASRHGMVPLLLSADEIRATSDEAFSQVVQRAFRNQYSEAKLEEYKQLDRLKKILIVDDWQRAKASAQWQSSMLALATEKFGKVIVFASDELRIEEFAGKPGTVSALLEFDRCEIRQMSHYLRGKLIEKWHALDGEASDSDTADRVEQDEAVISSMMTKNVLPCFPVTVLLVLQARESSKAANLVNGSYGYLYETLITTSLARVGGDSTEIDTRYTFISRIAHYLFERKQEYITEAEIQELSDQYLESYEIPIAVQKLVGDLEEAKLLVRSDGSLRFRYKYVFYYFVARYFQENLRSEKEHDALTTELQEMADRAGNEEYGNILMFVIYLTKDPDLIEHILQNAKKVFAEISPCDFKQDVAFLNNLTSPPTLELPASSVEENRQQRRVQLDELGDTFAQKPTDQSEIVAYDDQMSPVLKISFALRTLDLMGQVLRNFPGSLRKEIKVEIAKASYRLGLRLLHVFLGTMEIHIDQVRDLAREAIRLNKPKESAAEIDRMANEAAFFLARIAGFGLIKRVSYSVGAKVLERTYKSVHTIEGGSVPVSVIDLSIRLDHLPFPESEIRGLWARVRDNLYAATVTRDLVANHLYLHNVENRRRQSIESLLDIRTQRSLSAHKEQPGESKKKKHKKKNK